jgi:hypothetical protein
VTPYLLALRSLSMKFCGLRWGDVGLRIPPGWQRLVFVGVVVGVAMKLLELFATQPLLLALTGRYSDLSVLHNLVGNVPRLLLVIGAGIKRYRCARNGP